MGAWIEILIFFFLRTISHVAPLVGAWIEIKKDKIIDIWIEVAPLVGAWIEISYPHTPLKLL